MTNKKLAAVVLAVVTSFLLLAGCGGETPAITSANTSTSVSTDQSTSISPEVISNASTDAKKPEVEPEPEPETVIDPASYLTDASVKRYKSYSKHDGSLYLYTESEYDEFGQEIRQIYYSGDASGDIEIGKAAERTIENGIISYTFSPIIPETGPYSRYSSDDYISLTGMEVKRICDTSGNILYSEKANGQFTKKEYDSKGNLLNHYEGYSPTSYNLVAYTYNEDGTVNTLTEMYYSDGVVINSLTTTYKYEDGLLINKEQGNDGYVTNYTEYIYDEKGREISRVYSEWGTSGYYETVYYDEDNFSIQSCYIGDETYITINKYDSEGRTVYSDDGTTVYTYEYDNQGNRIYETVRGTYDDSTTSRTYDDRNRMIKYESYSKDEMSESGYLKYTGVNTYDDKDRVIKYEIYYNDSLSSCWEYEYFLE